MRERADVSRFCSVAAPSTPVQEAFMRMKSTIQVRGGRPLVDERGHVAETIRREPTLFSRLSNATRDLAGSPIFTVLLLLAVLGWLVLGPLVGFSKAWELSATAGTPILALILLVVIQHTQNRDDKAIHLKLNEVIRASEHASDGLIGIENSPEVELSRLLLDYRRHAGDGQEFPSTSRSRTDPSWPTSRTGRISWRRERRRRRYAEGDLDPERGFIFRSPDGRLNARAQSLALFAELAEAVDDTTWLYHLRRGDYSRWFREVIQDEALAAVAAQ